MSINIALLFVGIIVFLCIESFAYVLHKLKNIRVDIDDLIAEQSVIIDDLGETNCYLDQEFIDPIEITMEPIDNSKFYELPKKGSKFAAGYDIYWSTVNKELNEDGSVSIEPGETLIFGTNLKIMILIDNFYLDICSRSGMAIKENLIVVNSPARIDSDYRGELLVGIKNISNETKIIESQSRIAQCTLHRETPTRFLLGTVFDNTERSYRGLGHSGVK